jgi:hypothetical protein
VDEFYEFYQKNKKEIDHEIDQIFISYQTNFAQTYLILDGTIGCAQYLALLAYPSQKPKEISHRIKFFTSMISAYSRIYDNTLVSMFKEQPKDIQNAWLIKQPWKLIDQTISKGTHRLEQRLQAYHAYTEYNNAILNSADKSFEELLSWSARVYESDRSKLQDPKSRLENLKRIIHRSSRPVYHLIHGYYEEHLKHYPLAQRHPTKALLAPDWLEKAIITSRQKLASELLDFHFVKRGLQKPLKLKFTPSEVLHLELAERPFVGLSY